MKQSNTVQIATLALAGWLGTGLLCAAGTSSPAADRSGGDRAESEARAVVEVRDSTQADSTDKQRAWLGVAVEEAPEALSAQLGLEPGVGLMVLQVSPDSPAAKAGLKKNDVLAELAGHALAHPAQLRRLVQARQPGETVELVFYRAGKRQKVSVTLDKAPASTGLGEDWEAIEKPLREWQRQWRDLGWGDLWRDFAKQFREQWGRFSTEGSDKIRKEVERSLDQARQALQEATRRMSNAQPRIQGEIERSIEQARKALEEAARQMSNAWRSLPRPGGPLKDLLKGGVSVDKNASVVVRTQGETVRSIVKADDQGTVVIVGPPLRLTAHDKDGNLLFEGEIETPEQRAKVPPEVWKRVEPLLDESPSARPSRKTQPGRRSVKPDQTL
jgi:membrane-associated protease RseP (regulator of RpoE activity)